MDSRRPRLGTVEDGMGTTDDMTAILKILRCELKRCELERVAAVGLNLNPTASES
jgi:hypothetical protein